MPTMCASPSVFALPTVSNCDWLRVRDRVCVCLFASSGHSVLAHTHTSTTSAVLAFISHGLSSSYLCLYLWVWVCVCKYTFFENKSVQRGVENAEFRVLLAPAASHLPPFFFWPVLRREGSTLIIFVEVLVTLTTADGDDDDGGGGSVDSFVKKSSLSWLS